MSESSGSRPELSGVVRRRSESFGVVVVRIRQASTGIKVIWSRLKSIGYDRNQLESTGADSGDSARSRTTLDDFGRLRTTLVNSGRIRAIPDDFGRLRSTSDDSGQLRTTPDNSGRLRIMLGGSTFRSRFRDYRSRIGVDSGFLPTLPITSMRGCGSVRFCAIWDTQTHGRVRMKKNKSPITELALGGKGFGFYYD